MIVKRSSEFISAILEGVPALEPVHARHISLYGETLPHVFMGDVSRFAADRAGRGRAGDLEAVATLLAVLEEALADPSEEVLDLIGTSFVEYIAEDASLPHPLRAMLGSRLLRMLEEWESWAQSTE